MKVEIWSDVMCPFCYIGKRRFEAALEKFDNKNEVEVEWRSFQLNPHMKTVPGKSLNEYLAETKGWTLDYARRANEHVTNMAAEEGLEYHMDKAVVANSFDAHRLLQLAKTKGLGDQMEEQLFKAYFTEGKNTADHNVLVELGTNAGLDNHEIREVLESNAFADEVSKDLELAEQFGIRGVPFFVFDRKYAVSGAQPEDVFLQTMDAAGREG